MGKQWSNLLQVAACCVRCLWRATCHHARCDRQIDGWHPLLHTTSIDCSCCRRLCPADKQGKRTFAPVMLGRLQRLGISKTDPDELTPEEVCEGHTLVQGTVYTRLAVLGISNACLSP